MYEYIPYVIMLIYIVMSGSYLPTSVSRRPRIVPKKNPQKKPCSESHIFSVFWALGVPRTLQSGPLKSLYHSATESTCIAKCIDFTNRF